MSSKSDRLQDLGVNFTTTSKTATMGSETVQLDKIEGVARETRRNPQENFWTFVFWAGVVVTGAYTVEFWISHWVLHKAVAIGIPAGVTAVVIALWKGTALLPFETVLVRTANREFVVFETTDAALAEEVRADIASRLSGA